jgi:protein phosphatase 1 regulatory subunit 3A/B/C/D/E
MPIDSASYLLSTSPPAFELHYSQRESLSDFTYKESLKFKQKYEDGVNGKKPRAQQELQELREYLASKSDGTEEDELAVQFESIEIHESPSDRQLDKLESESCSIATYQDSEHTSEDIDDQYFAALKARKKVSFADEKGKSLYCVKVFHETSDTPPSLSNDVLSQITENTMAVVTNVSPYTLDFEQPASNYMAFREKLEHKFVSLEYVLLKDYNVLGTIKVKNIAFDKTVFVRFTVDGWKSFGDKAAEFQPNGVANGIDTFQFEFSIPNAHDVTGSIEFCICFTANDQEYWDNNESKNYRLLPADWKNSDDKDYCLYDARHFDERWSEFSIWHHTNASIPYY